MRRDLKIKKEKISYLINPIRSVGINTGLDSLSKLEELDMSFNAIDNLVVPKGIQNVQILNLEDSLIDLVRECSLTLTHNNLIRNCIPNRL